MCFLNELKNKLAILKKMGLSVSNAVKFFYRKVVTQRGLPFELEVPNEKTMKAIRSSRSGKGRSFSTAEELFMDLGI
jgi:DNA-damage-inducible protein J